MAGENVPVAGREDAGRTSPWSEGEDPSRPGAVSQGPGASDRADDRRSAERQGRQGPADPPGRLAGVVALLVVAVLGAALAGPWEPPTRTESLLPWEPPEPPEFTMPPPHPELQLAQIRDTEVQPWDLTWLGVGLLAVIVAWIVYLVVRWFRRHPVELPPEAPDDAGLDPGETLRGPGVALPDLPALRAAVAGADLLVRRRVPPTEAVVAAWVHLEDAAGRSGVPRKRTQTPTEFTVDVLDRTPVDPAATRALLALYLRARFGDDPMTSADVAGALAALTTLAEGLGHPDAAHLDEVEIVLDELAEAADAAHDEAHDEAHGTDGTDGTDGLDGTDGTDGPDGTDGEVRP